VAVVGIPAPPLRPFVLRYCGFEEEIGAPLRRREGPGAEVVLILSFGYEWRIGLATDPARPLERHTSSFIGGLHDACVLTEHDGRAHGVHVGLSPPGAYSVFGVPMHELAGRTVALDALIGRHADRLTEQLATAGSWAERFGLLDAALAARVARRRHASPVVVWAWRRLSETHGRMPIGVLAEELGWSRKRIVARFREEVGVPPKSLARLLRFERAKALLERADRPGLAEVAVECGYYDQSHLGNEIRRITGTTPTAYAACPEGTNFQDGLPLRA
jgi:AraC-like DNA-binding protein